MIPGADFLSGAISRLLRLGGYSADVGSGIVPTLATSLDQSHSPPFRPVVISSQTGQIAAQYSYMYLGIPLGASETTRLVIDDLSIVCADTMIRWGIEIQQVGVLRAFGTASVAVASVMDASTRDIVVASAVAYPTLKVGLYVAAGEDATDLTGAAGVTRQLTTQANVVVQHRVQFILKPGVFLFLQSNQVNQFFSATAKGRLYD